MKRVTQGGDINFNVTDVKGLGENYAFRFYTTDSNKYIVKVDGDADEGIIRLEWDELKTLGDGVLCYYADNLEPDEEYSDGTFNRTFGGTTQWYIVTGNSGGGSSEEISELSDRLDAEIARSSAQDTQHNNLIAANTHEIQNLGDRLYTDTYTKAEVDRKIAEAEMGGELPSGIVIDANYNHTDNNFTNAEKTKLDGIATGAEVNVQADWNVTDTSSDAYIQHKPTIPTKTSDLTNDSNFVVDANYVHTDNNYTTTEKTKLEGLSNYNDTALSNRVTATETALSNTYRKNETYSQTEVDNLIDGIDSGDAVGVQSIVQTTTSTESGGTNIITSTLTDGTTSTFQIRNGLRGEKGDQGDTILVDSQYNPITDIVNDLSSGGSNKMLSAQMGLVLRSNIEKLFTNQQTMLSAMANLAFSSERPVLQQPTWPTITYNVTLDQTGLTNCTASSVGLISAGDDLVITLNPSEGYTMAGVTVTVSTTSGTVTQSESGRQKIVTVSNVNANVTVTLSATAIEIPSTLSLNLTGCTCSSHSDGDTITKNSTISVVLNANANYQLIQNGITVTGGTAQTTISNDGGTATISIIVNGDVTVTAVAETSLSYVTDGLVFHLDGTDVGNVSGAWVDKIGGITFKNNGNCTPELGSNNTQIGWAFPTETPKGYFAVMDGSSWDSTADGSKVMTNLVTENGVTHFIIGTASGTTIGSKDVTIEVVAKLADNMTNTKSFIFMGSQQSSSATDWNAPYMDINTQSALLRLYGNSSKHWSYTATYNQKATVSMSSGRAYANGNSLSSVAFTSKHADTNEGGVFVGATRGSGYTSPTNIFSGSIYAVRIYNRVLTANEVLHNQYVDNQLYELGLSITDPIS